MASLVILHTLPMKVIFIALSASYPIEVRFFFSFGTFFTFLNFSIELLERLTTISPFLTMSYGVSSLKYTFPSLPFTQFWKISCQKVVWKEVPESITHDSLDSAKERSRRWIHHSLWYARNPSPCPYLLHHSTWILLNMPLPHCEHPALLDLDVPLPDLDFNHTLFFISLFQTSLSDRHSRYSLMSQLTLKTSCASLLRSTLITSSNFKVPILHELVTAITKQSQDSGRLNNRTTALILSSK